MLVYTYYYSIQRNHIYNLPVCSHIMKEKTKLFVAIPQGSA